VVSNAQVLVRNGLSPTPPASRLIKRIAKTATAR
jgi:hypothetical protein